MPKFTRPVGMKFKEGDFARLRELAAKHDKRLGEWCRDKLLETLDPKAAFGHNEILLAEIAATQAILIDLIYTWAQDGKLTQKGVQEIVNTAQRTKFKEAEQLFQAALARLEQRPAAANSKGNF
jgi:hypothetical protein